MAIGCPGRRRSVGAVYRLNCDRGVCRNQTRHVPQGPREDGDEFGKHVHHDRSGCIMAVGAPGTQFRQGAVHIFSCRGERGERCGPAKVRWTSRSIRTSLSAFLPPSFFCSALIGWSGMVAMVTASVTTYMFPATVRALLSGRLVLTAAVAEFTYTTARTVIARPTRGINSPPRLYSRGRAMRSALASPCRKMVVLLQSVHQVLTLALVPSTYSDALVAIVLPQGG